MMKPITEEIHEEMLIQTLAEYREVIPYRSDLLFTDFLPRGYRMTTLSCVPDFHLYRVLIIKWNLGVFITLLDDFADNPELRNKKLLAKLYRVPFDDEFIEFEDTTPKERDICNLALKLRSNMKENISSLPAFLDYYDIFKFDFEQVMRANQYSELMTDYPEIINPTECEQFGAYNMGIVLAGMIDLMSCESLADPLGKLRQVFIHGQRHGRLSNVVTTMQRECSEDDRTNELVSLSHYHGTELDNQHQLAEKEMAQIRRRLGAEEVTQFDLSAYVQGLRDLHSLHCSSTGTI